MRTNLIATGLIDDPDPEGVDNDGMLPLYREAEDDDDAMGAAKSRDTGDEEPPLVEPSSIEVNVPEDEEFTDDDDAYGVLTSPGASDLSPGEAQALINYMRPMSDEEHLMLEEPMFN